LDLADKLVPSAGDEINVIISQVSPFLFDLSSELFPLSRNSIPIHFGFPPLGLFLGKFFFATSILRSSQPPPLLGTPKHLLAAQAMQKQQTSRHKFH
jgi:hypothetical protein